MFAPETEDMLPRAAPKPSAPSPLGQTEAIAKPSVPEVSILFGQEVPQQRAVMQQQQQAPPPSFASWKKQMLPRVNFSPILTTELGPVLPSSSTMSTASTDYANLPRTRVYQNDPALTAPSLNQNVGYVEPLGHYRRDIVSDLPLRRSLDSVALTPTLMPTTSTTDVLTICAGTQTEAVNISPKSASLPSVAYADLSNMATKKDLADVVNLIELMRKEQQQLRNLCESFLQQQLMPSSNVRMETGVQCEILTFNNCNQPVKRLTPIIQDYISEEEEQVQESPVYVPYNNLRRIQPQYQSSRATPPMAQSTGYRPNTPQTKQQQSKPTPPANVNKPSNEKSMVMNELALKYLPQQQLNELMQDLRVTPTHNNNIEQPAAPLRQIDNLAQSPNDISNASYKYLKKYRLLPEEQLQLGYTGQDHMQSPLVIRQQQARVGSPLPMGMASPHQSPQNNMLDLENIRNQPKLL